MDAGKLTINGIFNGNRILEIPFFQRAYVWGEEQWERLLDDMESVSNTNKPYFLGSVIMKQQPTKSHELVGDIRTLIDGQQRLTTLNIFFKVLALLEEKNSSFERIFKLEDGKLALWHNHNDIQSFEKVLNLTELETFEKKDKIIDAYHYFKDNINKIKLNRQIILNNLLFVAIDLSLEEDEQQIFDTINSLGVRLTTAELLKNYFFNREDLDEYNEYWKNIFEKDDEIKSYWDRVITTGRLKRTIIDLFFYSYLQIKIHQKEFKVKAEDKSEFTKVESLFESYKQFIKDYKLNKKELLKEIKEYAIIFKDNFDYDVINKELTNEFGIDRINAIIFGLETSTLIPYVLYILKNVLDESIKTELFSALESFILRRMIVKASTKGYSQLFTDRLILNQILTKESFKKHIESSADDISFPSDNDLEKGFDESIIINKQAAGILYFIESKIRDKEKQATQLLGIKRYSLEHLMPKKWENKWKGVSNPVEKEIRNKKLRTLGNLAIITQSLNASIRDSNWPTKKRGMKGKFGLKHYSSGIETLAPYLDLPEWNEIEIEKRADFLFNNAKEIWNL